MSRKRISAAVAGLLLVALSALAVAACGGGGATAATHAKNAPVATSPKPSGAVAAMVRVTNTRLGKILVNAAGRTLYLFGADVGTASACAGPCAVAWPPLLTHATPAAGSGVNATLIGTTKRSDGTEQVTYNGHPLYLFVKDKKAGQTAGQGVNAFGGPWYVLSPAGNEITSRSSAAPRAKPAPPPAPNPAPPPATSSNSAPSPATNPAPPPAAKPAPPASSGIPQNNGGDGDGDNNGGPSDGDGNV